MFWVKKHITPEGGLLLACCDAELLDTEYEEGDRLLSFPKSFYGEKEIDEPELLSLVQEARVIMLGGKRSVLVGTNHHLISEEHVHTVSSVPHAHCVIDFESSYMQEEEEERDELKEEE